uniref:WRKY transcription factor 56 n=1 Tax=Santalum album TaxID=35974 RepID=A0A650C2Z0_SANAL|nr:WRKY transcription factor 56 [Santalum album]
MENYNQGDLADVVRAGGVGTTEPAPAPAPDWLFSTNPIPYPSGGDDRFGDPFSDTRDPLLHEIDMAGLESFIGANSTTTTATPPEVRTFFGVEDDTATTTTKNKDVFSRMLQISPDAQLPASTCDAPTVAVTSAIGSPGGIKGSSFLSSDVISGGSSRGCLLDTTTTTSHGIQISSPRNPGATKRRKSQAKKVVCIPAPAPASSRPSSGEVVPSDLWAWRKYGQKPIKGSPYPRGYYRCSSSKGCSARKQVERSRTDPNMLVITYTSDHNHPWPTQRNALAGSTRSQPSKINPSPINRPKSPTPQPHTPSNASSAPSISEEDGKEEKLEHADKKMEAGEGEFSEGIPYRPALNDSDGMSEDLLFADLEEIEAGDPMNLLLTQGFGGGGDGGKEGKPLDPFDLYDWTVGNSSSFGEGKRSPGL